MKFAAAVWILLAASTAASAEEVTPLSAGLREYANLLVTCVLREAHGRPNPGAAWKKDCETHRYLQLQALAAYRIVIWAHRTAAGLVFLLHHPLRPAARLEHAESLKRTHVVVMPVESRNGRLPATIGTFLAAHESTVKRIRIQRAHKCNATSRGARPLRCVHVAPAYFVRDLQGSA